MLFTVNPNRGAGFVRTIRVEGQPARVCRFHPGAKLHLNEAERRFMATEIEAGIVGPVGKPFPPPLKPEPPRFHPLEDRRDFNAEGRRRRTRRQTTILSR